jgi:GntR family transcriptional regulator of arabinose operon
MSKKYKPLYKKIESYIVDQIRSQHWKPLSRIPSENELAEQFKVSRITVKNALTDLVDRGVVYRQQGKGTFVADHYEKEILSLETRESDSRSASRTIGFLMPRLDNGFTANLLSGIEDALAESGYHLLFSKTNDSQEDEILKIREMLQYGVQGLIIYPVEGEIYNNEILSLTLGKFPLVLLDRLLRGIDTNSVSSNHSEGAMAAVHHLHELGHQHIGFISTKAEGTSSMEERLAGYEKALEYRHILINRGLEMTHLSIVSGIEEAEKLIEQFLLANPHMTALLSSNYSPQVIQTAHKLGIQVPEDLSVVFFDDVSDPDFAIVPPTVVVQQERNLGREAGRLIVEQIESGLDGYRQVKLPTELKVRRSTAKPNPSKRPIELLQL